jgi:TRAP-type mannitol/chloroaromatic compound transport system substrate-binding protein
MERAAEALPSHPGGRSGLCERRLRKLIAGGTELRAFSQSIVEASLKASNLVNAATTAANLDFKKVLESMQAFRNE